MALKCLSCHGFIPEDAAARGVCPRCKTVFSDIVSSSVGKVEDAPMTSFPKMEPKKTWIPQAVTIPLLLWALYPGNPDGYYLLLRLVVAPAFVYLAANAVSRKKPAGAWVFGFVALFYNPIIRFNPGRETWLLVNLLTAAISAASIFFLNRKAPTLIGPELAGKIKHVFTTAFQKRKHGDGTGDKRAKAPAEKKLSSPSPSPRTPPEENNDYLNEKLILAIQECDIDALRLLIRNGAGVNGKSGDESTPLHLASVKGLPEAAGLLIDHGADLNALDKAGRTPLYCAVEHDRVEIVRLLVAKGANFKSRLKFTLGFVKMVASEEGDYRKLASEKGPNPNIGNKGRSTPLHCAVRRGNKEITGLLVEKGADVNARDHFGMTPLHWASWAGDAETAAFLLDNAANPGVRDLTWQTPLDIAARRGHVEIAALLSKGKPGERPR